MQEMAYITQKYKCVTPKSGSSKCTPVKSSRTGAGTRNGLRSGSGDKKTSDADTPTPTTGDGNDPTVKTTSHVKSEAEVKIKLESNPVPKVIVYPVKKEQDLDTGSFTYNSFLYLLYEFENYFNRELLFIL